MLVPVKLALTFVDHHKDQVRFIVEQILLVLDHVVIGLTGRGGLDWSYAFYVLVYMSHSFLGAELDEAVDVLLS